jgi:hypothetical protein
MFRNRLTLRPQRPPPLSAVVSSSVKLNNKQVGRYLLGFYAFMMVLVMIMEFAAAMAIFTYLGKLENVNPDAKGVSV